MRRKAKLIVPLAVAIVVAIVAVSLAAGGDGGDGDSAKTSTSEGWTSYGPLTEGERELQQLKRERQQRARQRGPDPEVLRVTDKVRKAALEEAPEVAAPVIARARERGRITSTQADALRQAADRVAGGQAPEQVAPTLDLRDWDVRVVVRDAFEALSRRGPAIAQPIIDEAVQSGQITAAQAGRVRRELKRAAALGSSL